MTDTSENTHPVRAMSLHFARLAIGCLAMFGAGLPAHAQNAQSVFPPDAYVGYAPNVQNGEYMFHAAGCGACHGTDADPTLLSGGLEMRAAVGTFNVPNISPDPTNGIGGWSNARFLNAVMRGLKEDGSHLYPVMPYTSYAGMKPEDVLDIKGYIETLPRSGRPNAGHQLGFPFNVNMTVGGWKALNPLVEDFKGGEGQLARGEYLVRAVGHCAECHTPRNSTNWGLDRSREFEGEKGLTGSYAPAITKTALAEHKLEDFTVNVLQEGQTLDGTPLSDPTMRHLAEGWRNLSKEDRIAIYAFLVGEEQSIELAQVDSPGADGGQGGQGGGQGNGVQGEGGGGQGGDQEPQPVAQFSERPPAGPLCAVDEAAMLAEAQSGPNEEAPVVIEVTPAVQAEAGPSDLDRAADAFMGTYCRGCHGLGEKYQSLFPTGSLQSIANNPKAVVKGDPETSPLYLSVASGSMPKGSQPSKEEVDTLAAWIRSLDAVPIDTVEVNNNLPAPRQDEEAPREASADPVPEWRNIISREDEVDAAVRDISLVDEFDRPYIRYFSLRAQYNSFYPCESETMWSKRLTIFRAGFLKFLNSVSYGAEVTSGWDVEGTNGMLIRIDIRDLEWSNEQYDALVAQYMYGIDPRSDAPLNTLAEETQTALPIMRADWFMSFGSRPELYATLLNLPADIRILEDRMGVNVNRNIERRDIIRGAFLERSSGVSDHNRMVERHDLPGGGYYWKSYDFAGSVRLQDLRLYPHGPKDPNLRLPFTLESFEHDGGEMIFQLPNGLQGYYLSTAAGAALLEGPTNIVSFRERPIGKGVAVLNGRSCFNCHYDGMIFKRDELREVIESSSRFSLDESEFLLGIYVPNEELQEAYQRDRDSFVASLVDIGATMPNVMGVPTSMPGPAGEESVNYYADVYEEDLDLRAVAAEFDLQPEEFINLSRRIRDPQADSIVTNWLSLFDIGQTITRPDLEVQYPYLVETLMQLEPLVTYLQPEAKVEAQPVPQYQQALVEDYKQQGTGAYVEDLKQNDQQYPQQANAAPVEEPMKLTLKVDSGTNVKVGDYLAFSITSTKDCEAQMFYVESGGGVEQLDVVMGDANLRAGQAKQIPDPTKGRLRFDGAAYNESLVVYCRAGGLGDRRLSVEDARRLATSGGQGATSKSLVVELSDRAAEAPASEATHMVTFNVSP